MTLPNCPECGSEYTYEDRGLLICPECGNEWNKEEQETVIEDGLVVLDANGNRLLEGDSVTVIKDLKVKGASGAIKQGTKVKNIRLVEDLLSPLKSLVSTIVTEKEDLEKIHL